MVDIMAYFLFSQKRGFFSFSLFLESVRKTSLEKYVLSIPYRNSYGIEHPQRMLQWIKQVSEILL